MERGSWMGKERNRKEGEEKGEACGEEKDAGPGEMRIEKGMVWAKDVMRRGSKTENLE